MNTGSRVNLFDSTFNTSHTTYTNSSNLRKANTVHNEDDDFNSAPVDYSETLMNHLESQNDEEISGMHLRLKKLKNLSLKMNDEIDFSNNDIINNLNGTFGETVDKLKNVMTKAKDMADRSRISFKTWLTVFFFVSLLFIYIWLF
ncbi:related to Protein transport protein BET1 [Hanseniaspora guilliermondii]|uniref:Related to Protein transport protein BET1 n=1 Tax=Hanseniaspora guilliermondii TaxID=56406 RepID=A0A1L0CHW3_9ASCO|nr:related to Protein transport protein BET1 [Hanseniaspora guilliermondii]